MSDYKSIKVEINYVKSIGHKQAELAYKNSLESLAILKQRFKQEKTMNFDELAKYHSLSLMKWDEDFYASENTQLAKAFYEAGQQSKQDEVDLLQKRIDDALEKCCTGIRKQGGDYYLELIEGILKGIPNNHIGF